MAAATLPTATMASRTPKPTPSAWAPATISPEVTMKAADSTLTAAITRARRPGSAQAWTAAKDGTMNSPPAVARPNRSMVRRQPSGLVIRAAGRASTVALSTAKARSKPNSAMAAAPIGTTPRLGRNLLARAARNEPVAMPSTKSTRQVVTSASLPPQASVTIEGSSDSVTAPTSQNHETASAPVRSRRSAHRTLTRRQVEARMLRSTVSASPSPAVEGMRQAKP
jgi:hypothetical protein